MGAWGSGNFDDDAAADHLSIVTDKLITEIEEAFKDESELEPDEYWGVAVPCNLELLLLIHKQGYVGSMLPSLEQLITWKKVYMDVWDRCIDGLEPKPEHKKNRRMILLDTFDNLIEIVKELED